MGSSIDTVEKLSGCSQVHAVCFGF